MYVCQVLMCLKTLMCVILFILLLISITSFIVPNNDHDINISCLLLRSVQFKITYTWSLSFCLSVSSFDVVVVAVVVVVLF